MKSNRGNHRHTTVILSAFLCACTMSSLEAHTQMHEAWRATYDGPGGGYDRAGGIAMDAEGNVYVTGGSEDENSADFVTIKYDAQGNQLWVARYDGGRYGAGGPVTVDAAGNVYVTGNSYMADSHGNYSSGNDIATIKYDRDGKQLWVARYDGEGDSVQPISDDFASALAVDAAGNVYVGGSTYPRSQSWRSDYLILKYDAGGNPLWVARYDGSGTGDKEDTVKGLAVDAAGNVYVTGTSEPVSSIFDDYATIKYDSNGNQLWAARYDGGGSDGAGAVAVDSHGNVYVTGGSSGASSGDFATIKYDANGRELWVKRYDAPEGRHDFASVIAVETNGSVYVSGSVGGSSASQHMATLKYDRDGNQLWVVQHETLTGNRMALAPTGDFYVVGTTVAAPGHAVRKYDSNGNWLWEASANPARWTDGIAAIALGANGIVGLTGTSGRDYTTIAFDATGNSLWLARYDGHGGSDVAYGIAVDADGNSYVTGTSEGAAADHSVATIKYDAQGRMMWVAHYGVSNAWNEVGGKIAVDAAGCVYVAGNSQLGVGSFEGKLDYLTLKYDPAGNLVWSASYDGGYDDRVGALKVDAGGNVYVTGASAIGPDPWIADYATIKYDPNGCRLWVARLHAGSAHELELDSAGNVYVAGETGIVKYDPHGNELWARSFEFANDLSVDESGSVYVTGWHRTAKYDSDGNELWARQNWTASMDILALDTNGGVVVSGGVGEEVVATRTIKYDANGNELWQADAPLGQAAGLRVDPIGQVCIATPSGVVKYSSNGNELWIFHRQSTQFLEDLAFDSDGSVYVTGFSFTSNYETIKYIRTPALHLTRDLATSALTISWEGPATDFVLERSDTLNSSWAQIPFPYQTNAGRIFITEPSPAGNRFYRLRKP